MSTRGIFLVALALAATLAACGGNAASSTRHPIVDDDVSPGHDDDNDNDVSPDDDASPDDDDQSPDDDDNDNDDNDDDNDVSPDDDASPADDDTFDSDQDGVSDLQERLDGTNPFDPSDALEWHPHELTTYPRLFADAAGWQAAKAAIQAGDPDATRLYNSIKAQADAAPLVQTPGDYNFPYDEVNGQIAASAAFVAFYLNDATYAAKAAATVEAFNFELSDYSLAEWDLGTIHGGMALTWCSLAFDLLKGFNLIDATDEAAMTTAVLNYAHVLYHLYVELLIGKLLNNNHMVRLSSGLGITGMTFNMQREAAVYTNLGMTLAPYIQFDFQMPEGGGTAEGPYYLIYSQGNLLPWIAAYHRFAQGRSYLYKTDCRPHLLPCATTIDSTVDLAVDPRLTEILDWQFGLSLPNGYCPPIADSNLYCPHPGVIAALFNRPDFAWLYRQSPACSLNDDGLALLLLPLLPQMPAPAAPTVGPSIFKPNAGQAVLRSGWGADDFYGLLTGENGKARLDGLGHKQPDASSFLLYAMGEMFAIDSGYGSYADRWPVMQPKNHSLILVNELGPSFGFIEFDVDSNAYLSEFFDVAPFHSARVDTAYQGATIARRLVLIDGQYFVTSDVVTAASAQDYAWLLQTLAGGDTDGVFTLEADGALIERPNGAMRTYLQSDSASLALSQVVEDHSFADGQLDTHAVLRGDVSAANARFLAAHVVATAASALPPTTAYRQGDLLVYYIDLEDTIDAVIANPGGAYQLAAADGFPGDVASDAEFVWVRVDASTGELLASEYLAGTYVNYTPAVKAAAAPEAAKRP